MLLAALLTAGLARAAGPKLELKTIPAKLQLSASDSTKATVVVTNSGDASVSHLSLGLGPGASLSADTTVKPTTSAPLAAGGSLVYQLTVPAWTLITPPPELTLLGEYRVGGVDQAVAAGVEQLAPTPLDPDKVASVELKASLATLKSGQTEPVYLLVHNKSAQPLTVERIVAKGPSFIEFRDLPTDDVAVKPGRIKVLTVNAHAKPEVRPGEQQLVFRLLMRSGKTHFDLAASQSTKVAVTGESEVLTALGVPSLLLLPGFLVLAAASVLWRLRWQRKEWDGEPFPFSLKEPEFWVIAVSLSIVIVFVAKCLGTDLFGTYGLEDLICIWFSSIALGALGYFGIVWEYNRRREARIPGSEDTPIGVLRKLARQGLNLERPRIAYDVGGGQAIQLYLLQAPSDIRPATWAAPLIAYEWAKEEDAGLEKRIQLQLDETRDADALASILAEGEEKRLLTTRFTASGGKFNTPILVPKEKITPTSSALIVGEG